MPRFALLLSAVIAVSALTGCAAALSTVASTALQASGLGKPELPENQKPPRMVPLTIIAGPNLNEDARRRPQAVIVRIYKLKEASTFWLAPFDSFVYPEREKSALGDNLVEVKEITLVPGQQYIFTESVQREAKALGVVVLFHSAAPQRWKVAFDVEKSEKTGVLIGVHACGATVTRGSILRSQTLAESQSAPNWTSLAQVECKYSSR